MQTKLFTIVFFVFFIFFSEHLLAQDVKSVDPKTLPESDIKRVENAIKESGMSFEEAATLARQRGASEQQIRDMQQRLQQGSEMQDTEVQETEPQTESANEIEETFETSARRAAIETSTPIFGAYLFNNENLTFEPSLNIQTPGDYEIGIGDQVIISIWGNSQNNYQLTVNRNGQIMVPDVGPVYLADLSFNEAEKKIINRLTEIYADMEGPNPQTFAQVNMGRLRSIKINLVEEVNAPGTYTLPVTSTAFNALYLSGGPNQIGSFRDIRIIRNNKIFKTIDIYKFLIDGNISENILLKDEDIIFIPPAEKRVTVSGEFKRPGIFELKDNEQLDDLIRYSGGFTEDAWWSDLKIYRKTLTGKVIIDVKFSETETTLLHDGDIIMNGKVLDLFKNRVTISGPVIRPGEYEWEQGLTVMDLIMKADSLVGDIFVNRANILRLNDDLTTSSISFDVGEIVRGEKRILLQPEDVVILKSNFDLRENRFISVTGEVLNPGQIPFSENITLGDAIFRAGGFTEAADISFIEVARRLSYEEAANLSDQMVHIFTFDLSRGLHLQKEDAGFTLKPFDQISVRRAPGFNESASVQITGEVKYAGRYAIQNKNQRISDLIEMAGGITPQSFLEGATLSRQTNELGSEFVAIHLQRIMENKGGQDDLFLRNGDVLHIPQYIQTVKVTGSVQNPFSITYEKGKNLKYYIDKCGGFSTEAMRRKTFVKYPNGATASTKSFIVKSYPEILPGSQIVVPVKPDKEGMSTGQWLSIASTFSSIAVAIAAILR
jgi:protein involved in polysaccharide export with SLBB domain